MTEKYAYHISFAFVGSDGGVNLGDGRLLLDKPTVETIDDMNSIAWNVAETVKAPKPVVILKMTRLPGDDILTDDNKDAALDAHC